MPLDEPHRPAVRRVHRPNEGDRAILGASVEEGGPGDRAERLHREAAALERGEAPRAPVNGGAKLGASPTVPSAVRPSSQTGVVGPAAVPRLRNETASPWRATCHQVPLSTSKPEPGASATVPLPVIAFNQEGPGMLPSVLMVTVSSVARLA